MRAWILPVLLVASRVSIVNAAAFPESRLNDLLVRKAPCTNCEQEPQYTYNTAGIAKEGLCRYFTTNPYKTRSELASTCTQKCGNVTAEADSNGNGAAFQGCIELQPVDAGGGGVDPDGDAYNMGNCVCDIPILDQLVGEILLAIAEAAKIGCEILMDAAEDVLEYGADAIPGVGEAMTIGMKGAVQTAKTMAKYGKKSSDFLSWLNPCGPPDNYTQKIDDIFDPMSAVEDSVVPPGACVSGCPSSTVSISQAAPAATPTQMATD